MFRGSVARATLLAIGVAPAVLAGDVLSNGTGVVEFLGLERLTADGVHAALGGAKGSVHYCAVDLLAKAGVADASVVVHFEPGGKRYDVVTLLEPERAKETKLFDATAAAPTVPPALTELAQLLDADEGLRNAILLFAASRAKVGADDLNRQLEETYGTVPPVEPIFTILDRLRAAKDCDALVTLANSTAATPLRRAAIVALSNFGDRDEAWRTRVALCVDADEKVRSDARDAIFGALRAGPRQVDWKPAMERIDSLLAGSNLWALPVLFETLSRTEIEPELVRALVAARPRLVLEYALARHEATRVHARHLLSIAANADLGDDAAAWHRFIESLR